MIEVLSNGFEPFYLLYALGAGLGVAFLFFLIDGITSFFWYGEF